MTSIKCRKRQKIAYRIFACHISCHHYTMSDDDDSYDDRKFYKRKYDKRIFAVFYV